MKSCDEMVNSLLERRDRFVAQQKKKICFRVISSLCCVVLISLMGFGAYSMLSENSGIFGELSFWDKATDIDEPEKNSSSKEESKVFASDESIIEKNEVEALSPQDLAVKAEIAKYTAEAADFRYNRSVTVGNKKYDLTFSRVGFTGGDESEEVTYENKQEDIFVFNVKSGKLSSASLLSLMTPKNAKSININRAQEIALEYAKANCKISEYQISKSDEVSNGYGFDCYTFVYSKYISGIRTSDSFGVDVGFDGEIVGIRDNTGSFDGITTVDVTDIENKISAELSKHKNAELEDKWLDFREGKLVINCEMKYETDLGSTAACVAVIPLE